MSADFTGRRRILVVDDDERERQDASRILGGAGYAVDSAATKADVVTLLNQHGYDLVLADLKMPGLNGPAFYQLLKESCRTAPPVIFRIERGYTPEYANFLMRLAHEAGAGGRPVPGGGAPPPAEPGRPADRVLPRFLIRQ
jgi:DNA-binding NtrC family response regulator